MGWWQIDERGNNAGVHATGAVWGDGPADIMDRALDQIAREFITAWGRAPSSAELSAGLRFAIGGRGDDGG